MKRTAKQFVLAAAVLATGKHLLHRYVAYRKQAGIVLEGCHLGDAR